MDIQYYGYTTASSTTKAYYVTQKGNLPNILKFAMYVGLKEQLEIVSMLGKHEN